MSITGRHYTRKVEIFPSFQGGELGRRTISGPDKRGQFTATNMMVNYRGHLIVRPGLKNITPAGVANGVVQGFGGTPVPTKNCFYIQGTGVHTFDRFQANNYKTTAFTFGSTPTVPMDWVALGTQVYFVAQGSGSGVLQLDATQATPTVANLSGSPSGASIAVYNDRLVVGNINTPDNQIQWNGLTSGVSDFTHWPSTNFIHVGDPWQITGLKWQRNHLLIAKQNQWHVLTGVFGADGAVSNLAVRKTMNGEGPLAPQAMAMDNDDIVWFQGTFDVFPASTNGARLNWYRDITYSTSTGGTGAGVVPPAVGVYPIGTTDRGAVFITPTGVAVFRNNVWTKHTFNVPVTGGLGFTDTGPDGGGNTLYICNSGTANTPPVFYAWYLGSDTPGLESGGAGPMRAGDDSSTALTGSVSFPEWWDAGAAEVQVRAVIVDFTAYNTGSATTNHFDLNVLTMRTYEAGDSLSSTLSYDAAPSGYSTSGTRIRQVFGFSDSGLGNGFSLQFTNVRGIELERVECVLEDHLVRMGT